MKNILIIFIFLLGANLKAQHVPKGINFQGLARDPLFQPISNQNISLRISIFDSTHFLNPDFQEIHNTMTNSFGLFSIVIGEGNLTSNSSYSTLLQIDWSLNPRYMTIEADFLGGNNYLLFDTVSLVSVPYSLFSEKAGKLIGPMFLSDLADVDTVGLSQGKILSWNGLKWVPAFPSFPDSSMFAIFAQNSFYADTSNVAYQLLNPIDSVNFSYYSDSSSFSNQSNFSYLSQHSVYADTAQVALNCINSIPSWQLSGNNSINSTTDFIGTLNAADLVFKTNSIERARITSNGRFGIGTSTPVASLHVSGNHGLVFSGNFGIGNLPVSGAGTRMLWYPRKSAFRVGTVTGTQWDNTNIGNYSFATGLDNISKGNFSFSAGQLNSVVNDFGVGMGWGNNVSGVSAVAFGSANVSSGFNSIALGRANTANDSISIAMGYHATSSGTASIALGAYSNASGNYSIAMGYYANTNNFPGSFVFADFSGTSPTLSTGPNQFVSRASGGYYLYSSGSLASGVTLPAGSGSWNSLSDRNKKKNISTIDYSDVMEKFRMLEVSEWSYITQSDNIKHVGPMSQDFYSLFKIGENDSTISMVDIDGINMAVLKQLEKRTAELNIEIDKYKVLLNNYQKLKEQNDMLQNRILKIEAVLMEEKNKN